MRELPEELTAELLSLVLNKKVVDFTNVQVISGVFCDYMEIKIAAQIEPENILIEDCINIDTLTRLMKSFRYKNGLVIMEEWVTTTGNFDIEYTHENGDTTQFFNVTPEKYFECEVKSTHWVAKEKGLI